MNNHSETAPSLRFQPPALLGGGASMAVAAAVLSATAALAWLAEWSDGQFYLAARKPSRAAVTVVVRQLPPVLIVGRRDSLPETFAPVRQDEFAEVSSLGAVEMSSSRVKFRQ